MIENENRSVDGNESLLNGRYSSTARSQCEASNMEVDISEVALNVKELAVSVRRMKTLLFLCLCIVLLFMLVMK